MKLFLNYFIYYHFNLTKKTLLPSLRVILYNNATALLYKIVSRSILISKVLDTIFKALHFLFNENISGFKNYSNRRVSRMIHYIKKALNFHLRLHINNDNFYFLLLIFRANKVFFNNIAIVIGPTPPGTGVMKEDFLLTSAKSTSPVITYPFG